MKLIPLYIPNRDNLIKHMQQIGCSAEGINIMQPKAEYYYFLIKDVNNVAANIIKQQMLSLGSDAVLNKNALIKKSKGTVLIFGSLSHLKQLANKLSYQPFGLKDLAAQISQAIEKINSQSPLLKIKGKKISLKDPLICAIINVTPDSFSGDGLLTKEKNKKHLVEEGLRRAELMVKQGAKIIDIGAESSRPFALEVSLEEEKRRLLPVLKAIRKKFPKLLISVDTYKYEIAKLAAEEGADILNDITGLREQSEDKAKLIKKYNLGCVIMHMKGTPRTMQRKPFYRDVISELLDFFKERLQFIADRNIDPYSTMIDPGIGFGKRLEDNYKILQQLAVFRYLGRPLFLGLSRKSFVGNLLNLEVERRLPGSLSATVFSYWQGANIFRVHDVAETLQALTVAKAIIQGV